MHGAQIQKAGVMGYKYKKRCNEVQIQTTGIRGTNTNYRFLWFKNKIQVSAIKIKTTC